MCLTFINEYLEAEKEDLETLKDNINQELEDLDKKLLIVIDDIDRLCDEEIREIFQLVKSIADFKNTIYILSYDREIVAKALDKTQQDKGEEYLEKIVQVPIELPNITKLELENIFLKKIEQLIEDKEKELDYQYLNKLLYIMPQIFNNIREIERYINSISLGIYYAKRELNICDYLSINLIKFFETDLYNYILKSEKIFFEKEIKKDFLDKLEYYYKKSQKIEERFLKLIVTWMLPVINNKKKITFKSLEKNKRLNSPKYFYNYFKLNFSEVEINEDEIRKLRDFSTKKDLEELFNKNDEKKLNLIKKIDIILDEISEERRIKLLKYIFSIADDINFIDKIEGYDNYVSKNIYESEIITIIVKIFKSLKLENKYNKIKEILLAKKSSFYLSFLVLKELNIVLTENKIKKITDELVNIIIKRSEEAKKVFKNFYLILEFIYNEVDYSTSISIFHNYIKNKNLLIPIAKEFIEPDINIALNKIIKKEKKFYKELFEQFYNYHEFLKLIDENIKNPNQEEKEIITCIKNNIL
ncbi:KAP family NTPase [Fusobacterium polymorphum]|uniref:P-loop NTPase fold protein n=1 Tax=Fusobacterium nucleatum subsp. polymorphum TaxID=76857 RepID=UPI00164DBCAC|nr:P-loop NTPase fold protein [Fusobacterium polymorphum]